MDYSPRGQASDTSIPIKCADAGIHFIRINLTGVFQEDPAALHRVVKGLQRSYDSERACEIPVESFRSSMVEDAFNLCIRDTHIGRLVIDMADKIVPLIARLTQPVVQPDAAYLVTGGFGDIGVETIRWLACHGAKYIAVVSRSGPSSSPAQKTVRQLEESGVRVLHEQVDIADCEKLMQALDRMLAQMPPLRGVIHSAGVLDDNSVEVMDAGLVDRVMDAKAKGALYLYQACEREELDFFVCYASIAATLGNAGQFNYAAANGFLAGLVMYRRARGLPGTCINWGPVADVGMAARDDRVAEGLARAGLKHLPLTTVFEILDDALAEKWVSFDAVDIEWSRWSRQATAAERKRLSEVLPVGGFGDEDTAMALRSKVCSLGANERQALLFDLLVDITAAVLGITQSRIDALSNLAELGTDSIMAAEIRQAIFAQTSVSLRLLYLTRGPALSNIVKRIEEAILRGESSYTERSN